MKKANLRSSVIRALRAVNPDLFSGWAGTRKSYGYQTALQTAEL